MSPTTATDALVGRRLLGRYELLVEIGRGGRGVVYLAHDLTLDRRVALKLVERMLLTEDDQQRFEREALAAAKMDHPAIVALFDFCRDDDFLFLVMPYLEGRNLRTRMRLGLTPEEALAITRDAAGALGYSHGLGIVHRDVKPENIMLQDQGAAPPRAKLVDFGLAFQPGDERLTQKGALIGTLAYLSPEQVEGNEVGPATDVYALGVVLYECLVGSPPFQGGWQNTLYQIACEVPAGLLEQGVAIRPEVEELVLGCLAKRATERPSAEDLGGRLDDLLLSGLAGRSKVFAPRVESTPKVASGLIDRRREIALLEERRLAAADGQCQLVLLGGVEGIGKSTLAREFLARSEATTPHRLVGSFVDARRGSLPYEAYCEALLDFAVEHDRRRGRLEGRLADLWPDLTAAFPQLRTLATAGPSRDPGKGRRGSPKPRSKKQIFDLMARALAAITQSGPLILLLEELEHADASVELLQYLFRRLGPTPTLLLATYRNTEVDDRHPLASLLLQLAEEPHFLNLELAPLRRRDTRLLLRSLLDEPETSSPSSEGAFGSDSSRVSDAHLEQATQIDPRAPEPWFEALVETTGGNPRTAIERVRFLTASGALRRDGDGRWTLLQGPLDLRTTAPRRLDQILARRVEILEPEQREVLTQAAILGRSFRPSAFEAFGAIPIQSWRELIPLGFLVEFQSPRGLFLDLSCDELRNVLLEELPFRRRRNLHLRYARYLERTQEEPAELRHTLLRLHYTLADEPEKALQFGLLAAESQLEARCPEDAIVTLEGLLDLVEDDEGIGAHGPESWRGRGDALLAFWTTLARAYFENGRWVEAMAASDKAHQVASAHSLGLDPAALWVASRAAWDHRDLDAAWRWVSRGLEATAPDSGASSEALGLRCRLLELAEALRRHRGDAEGASQLRREAETLCANRHHDQRSASQDTLYAERLGELLLIRGEYLAAQEAFAAARDQRLSESDDAQGDEEARYRSRLAQLALKLGRYDEALGHCRAGLDLLESRTPVLSIELETLAALICTTNGDFGQADIWLERGTTRLTRLPGEVSGHDRRRLEGALDRARGNLLLGLGRPREAVTAFARSAESFDRIDDRWEHSIALYNRAEAEIRIGRHTTALDHLEQSLAEKSTLGDRWGMAHCHGGRAQILLDRGDLRGADEAITLGLSLAEEVADPKLTSRLQSLRGSYLAAADEPEEALRAFHLALRDAEQVRASPEIVLARLGLARISANLGRFEVARTSVHEAMHPRGRPLDPSTLAEAEVTLGRIELAEGRCHEALQRFESAQRIADELANPYQLANLEIGRGEALLKCGDHEASLAAFTRAETLGRQLSHPRLVAQAALGQAEAQLGLGEGELTLELAGLALEQAQRQDATPLVGATYQLLARYYTENGQSRRAETYARAAAEILSTPPRSNRWLQPMASPVVTAPLSRAPLSRAPLGRAPLGRS